MERGGVLLFLVALASLGGCARVKPFQREYLSMPVMISSPDAKARAEQHMLESREASGGGYGAVGGGCGCN